MQGKSKLFGSIIALLVIILAVMFMAGSFSDKQAPGNKPVPAAVYSGKVVSVELTSIKPNELVPGTVIAKQNTQISSRVMAQVERLNVRAGDKVVKGDVLITLQQDDFKAQLAQSDAQIKAIQASLTQAEKQLKRVNDLYSQGVVSVSDYDDAKAKFDNLTANLAIAQQQQTQAQVALSFTQIKAPISGVVVERLVEPGDTAAPGSPLLALYNPQQLQLEFNVRERQAIKLKLGDSLEVKLPSLNITADATVTEIVPVADSAARSMLIRLELISQIGLTPGLYAQLKLPLSADQGILISPDWVYQFGQLSMVYVINNDLIERRFVRLGEVINSKQHVVAGLDPSDKLAIDYKPAGAK
ncbi:efflux RND transporter periplasmic adaptor subunit [Pseudoalteromonas haloplanktis]|uniref:Efflux RND transporter periplasmic adaptor subunit n=1 Tax=Pseudoalteromonas haloplanktis TaxID=228 RepID=A0ABU1BGC5_PSEHA|nr:efflux RND transporter periplasmic adaptor subunit [Pseudoalteromonas haloplanktis]MDQ9092579.1 efflux RND transporter periplasmic adaptor subunit [Pseudoalteromonas haloplanktis]